MRAGTTEYWQGKELVFMLADFVRASNDSADLSFIAMKRLINVLLSRQPQGLTIIGDTDCVDEVAVYTMQAPTGTVDEDAPGEEVQADEETPKIQESANFKYQILICMSHWLGTNRYIFEVDTNKLNEEYIGLPAMSKPSVQEPIAVANVDWNQAYAGDLLEGSTKYSGSSDDIDEASIGCTVDEESDPSQAYLRNMLDRPREIPSSSTEKVNTQEATWGGAATRGEDGHQATDSAAAKIPTAKDATYSTLANQAQPEKQAVDLPIPARISKITQPQSTKPMSSTRAFEKSHDN